jgi:endoglucanase
MKREMSALVMLSVGLLALGCAPHKQGAAAPGGGPAGATPLPSPADVTRCGADGLIDDCEDNNNQIALVGGRGGYWYTFSDDLGSTIDPPKGGTFPMTAGGANGSGFAAHISGTIAASGSPIYAGVGFNWVDPKEKYDASKFGGIAFWAKKGPGSNGKIRIKLPDANTDPQGGVCTACFNDFGADIELTEIWTEYVITWEAAKQMPYWGNPTPPKIDSKQLYGFQVQVNKLGQKYDVWIDDVSFIGCAGGPKK